MTPEEFRTMHADLGISVSDLARAFGVQRRTIQRWQIGKNPPPAYVRLAMERLAQILDEESSL